MAPKKKRTLIPAKEFAPRKTPSRRAKGSVKDDIKEKETVKQPKPTKTAKSDTTKSPIAKSPTAKSSTAAPAGLEERLKAINERLENIETMLNTLNDRSESILTYLIDREER